MTHLLWSQAIAIHAILFVAPEWHWSLHAWMSSHPLHIRHHTVLAILTESHTHFRIHLTHLSRKSSSEWHSLVSSERHTLISSHRHIL